jgi:tetratricopeptide (TPR) repeat protein
LWIADFGLAKAVAQEDLSQTGDVVGTLRYMAPEQFDGAYDSRVDVYSLGLTLYELLTLRPAFDEWDHQRLIQKVCESNPTPPRRLRSDIPRDLETIILKAIARAPKHRYQTAADLADDLQRFLDDRPIRARRVGPVERLRRWARRNPAIAALSTSLLIVLIVSYATIGWKWREAEKENRRAEANLSLALDSMNAILERFASTWMAHPSTPANGESEGAAELPIVVSGATAAILKDALKFYDDFAEQNAHNPRLQRDTAHAHRRVGAIQQRLGRYREAETAYHQAVQIFERQRGVFPEDTEIAVETAETYNQLGLVVEMVGRREEAHWQFDRARGILSTIAHPAPDCRLELAKTHSNLGSILWRLRRRRQGAQHQQQAILLLEQLVAERVHQADYRLALARAYRNYFPFATFGQQIAQAVDYQSRAIALLEELVQDFPQVPDYRCELSEILAMTRTRRPSADSSPGRNEEAQKRRAVALAREINEDYPTIPRYRATLARALHQLGLLYTRRGQMEKAEPCLAEAVSLHTSLYEDFPTVPVYSLSLSMSLHSYGDTLRYLDRLSESRDYLEEAVALQRSRIEPGGTFALNFLARQKESLAETLRRMGEVRLAEEHLQEAQGMRSKMQPRSRSPGRGQKPSPKGDLGPPSMRSAANM